MVNSRKPLLMIGILLAVTGAGWYGYTGYSPSGRLAPEMTQAGVAKLKDADVQIIKAETKRDGALTPVERSIESAENWISRGKITADGADFDHAIQILDEADKLAVNAQNADRAFIFKPDLIAQRARVLRQRHHFLEAQAMAEKALVKAPNHEQLLGIAGDASVQVGDLRTGESYLRRLTNISPRIPQNWVALAYWAEISGDLEQAAELLRRAPEASFPKPVSAERQAYILSVLGDVLSKQGKFDEARARYDLALRKYLNYAPARSGLADVEQFVGNDPAAEKLLRGLIESEWPNADYKVKLSHVRDRLGDKTEGTALRSEAEKFYEWSVSTGYEGYLRPLATLKLEKGDFSAAAKFAERDLALRPNSESRAIYQNVLNQAKAAGKPVAALRLKTDTVVIAIAE